MAKQHTHTHAHEGKLLIAHETNLLTPPMCVYVCVYVDCAF